jgi:hypothetical protein
VFVTDDGHVLIREPDDGFAVRIELSAHLPVVNGRIEWPGQNLLGATQQALETVCFRLLDTPGLYGRAATASQGSSFGREISLDRVVLSLVLMTPVGSFFIPPLAG